MTQSQGGIRGWKRESKKMELADFDGHNYISAKPNEQVLWLRRG